jgi:hypothetical protein
MDISTKSRKELETLAQNAERILDDTRRSKFHDAASAMQEAVKAALAALPPRPGFRAAGPKVETATTRAIAALTEAAAALALEFDLSPPPQTSAPHKLVAADGTPKVGGDQRNRAVKVFRYLSHRRGTGIAMIAWIAREDDNEGGWQVTRRSVSEKQGLDTDPHLDAEAAVTAFRALLAAMGTPRRA